MADEDNMTGMEEMLRSLGAQADAGTLDPAEVESIGELETDGSQPAAVEGETSETGAAPGQDAAAIEEQREQTAENAESAKKEGEAVPENETPYQRAMREGKKREAAAWQKIEAEKAEIARAKLELQARADADAARAAAARPAAPDPKREQAPALRDGQGYTAAEYDEAAKGFEAEGDTEMAALARQKAGAVRQAEQQQRAQAHQQQFTTAWQQTVEKEVQATPELKDTNSPLGLEVQKVLRERPALSRMPDGFADAVQIAKARTHSAAAPALQSQIEKLTKENERLTKLTSLTGSGPARMSSGEEKDPSEKELRRMAAALDNESDA